MTLDGKTRISGAVLGHAVGDALGVPVEFRSRQTIDRDPVTDMRGFGTHNQPPGAWSDDTSLMLCLLDLLPDGFDLNRLARKFVDWRNKGYMTPHGHVFDIGVATNRAISRLEQGIPPVEAGEDGERSNGNGSLMRILPAAFVADASDKRLAETADRISCLTHRHPRSRMACGMYVLLIRRILGGIPPGEAYRQVAVRAADLWPEPPHSGELIHYERFLSGKLPEFHRDDISSSGYVVHTLEASVWCLLTTDSFEEAVLKAVNLGDDTDTTGAVTGGLAGAAYGLSAIPEKWIEQLVRGKDILDMAGRAREIDP